MTRHRMASGDAAWLHMDRPTNLMVVNAVLWTDEPIDRERVRAVVQERLVDRFPPFRRRVVEPWTGIGGPSWEDDPDFDLDLHLQHIALPAPGDRAALQRLVGDLMAAPLDRSKPLWQMFLVDGYGGGTAVVTRMHHCIADGIALARVLLSLTDEQPDVSIAPERPARSSRGVLDAVVGPTMVGVRAADALVHEGLGFLTHPGDEARGLTADARALNKLLLSRSDPKTAFKGRMGRARRVSWTDPMPLDRIKDLGHATGTTVNDVLLSAVTGALHRHLAEHGTVVDEIRAMVPFNLRPLDEPLPCELGNRFGLVYLPLPVGLTDPKARLREVHRRMEDIKHSPEAAISYGIIGLMGVTPLPVEQRLLGLFTPKATAVMTNVPGPRVPVYFAGTRVRGVIGWVPAAGDIALGLSIFSYDDTVTIGLSVDAGLVPDADAILVDVATELDVLERAAAPPRRRQTRTPRRARPPATAPAPGG